MSWDCCLCDPVTDETIILDAPQQMRGGTYQIGGSKELYLNVTYNYGKIIRKVMNGKALDYLDGMTGLESIPLLERAISKLSNEVNSDYWTATEGNVKRALIQLLTLAKMQPYGIWRIY